MSDALPLDRLALAWRGWTGRHARAAGTVAALGRLAAWAALLGAVVAFVAVPGTRGMWLQVLWSQYLLWQFFVLARTKSLS